MRPYAAILKDLAKPLPAECIATRQQGGKKIEYLHWYVVAEVLDHYAPGWTSDPIQIRALSGKIMAKVALTIRAADGTFTQSATGYEDDWDEESKGASYGDPLSNACAMAFKRAAVLFGVGRDLYDKDQALAKLRHHWAQSVAVDQESTHPLGYQPAHGPSRTVKTPPPPTTQEIDRGEQWHAKYREVLRLCEEHSFVPVRVMQWLRKTYSAGSAEWSTRDLTLSQLEEACMQLAARAFRDDQLAWLSAPMLATQEETAG